MVKQELPYPSMFANLNNTYAEILLCWILLTEAHVHTIIFVYVIQGLLKEVKQKKEIEKN